MRHVVEALVELVEAFPERSAAMTPIGVLMSYAAFVAKDFEGHWRHVFSIFGAGVVAVAALTWFGMSAIADSMEPAGHSHSDGYSESAANEMPAGQLHAPNDRQEAPGDEGAPAEHDRGSHSH